MVSSLIPDKSLVISPALAATIGLEEAVMLAALHELFLHRAVNGWVRIDAPSLVPFLPFWEARDIQRIATSLRDKGIIQLRSAPFLSSQTLDYSLQEPNAAPTATAAPAAPHPVTITPALGAQLLSPHWQPDADLLQQLSRLGIPAAFAQQQVPPFIRYWRDRNEAHHAWGNRFLKHVLRDWRDQEQHQAELAQKMPIPANWQPGPDALDILERAGVDRTFMIDCLPEFVLKWREKGTISSTWNTQFVQHIRQQWAIYKARLVHDGLPRPIAPDWQPDPDVYDILRMAEIDRSFAEAQVPEFVLYWRDSGQVHSSWNSKYLHHVKYRWARRHQQPWQGDTDGFIEKHTDRSWREGL